MTEEQALQLILSAMFELTGAPVYIADGDMPRPSHEHIWMRIRTDTFETLPSRGTGNTINHPRLTLIEFEALGWSAVAALKSACSRLMLGDDPIVLALGNAGIGIRSRPTLTNVSQLLRSSKEPRVSAAILFGYLFRAEVPQPSVVTAIHLDGYLENTLEYQEDFPIE